MELKNAKDIYQRVFSLKRRAMTRNVEPVLKEHGIAYSKFGDELLIAPDLEAAWEEACKKALEVRTYVPDKVKKAPARTVEESDEVATLRAEVETMFEIVNEQVKTIDDLHKCVEQLNTAYNAILKAMDEKSRPGVVIKLPTRYRFKVLIVGGDYRTLQDIEPRFPMIRFVHVESAGAAGEYKGNARSIPSADKVFLMTTYMGHSLEAVIFKRFRGEEFKIDRITGGNSALASAVSVWLHEQEREARHVN